MAKSSPGRDATTSHSSVFIGMALDMAWRLAIVVLVPVIGGFKLDEAFETAPVLTITGFFVAMGGMALVMWATLKKANEIEVPKLTPAQKRKLEAQLKEEDDD